jgi:hypothetical protein
MDVNAAIDALFATVDPIWLGWLAAAVVLACLNGRGKGSGQ